MLRAWRGQFFPFLFFLQASLAGLALHIEHAQAWLACLGLAAVLNLIGWLRALSLARAIADTPTSRIASAAQGFVELHGIAQAYQGVPLMTPHSQLPCLWYRYTVARRENDKWCHVDSAESAAPFDLDDGGGRCTLDPAGAHIESTHKEVRREGDLRHTEWVLLKGDALYVLGTFRSERPEGLVLNARKDEGDLLAEWKEDQEELRRRFDLDGDGAISPKEWMLARQAARREIAKRHQALRSGAVSHRMEHPDDGRPYLISNLPPDRLGKRYLWLSRLCLGLLLGCLA